MPQEVKPRARATRRESIGPYIAEDQAAEKAPYRGQRHANEKGRVRTYEAGRILDIGDDKRQPGELVPESHTWFRLQNLVHTGYLKSVEIPVSEFKEAVDKYCPELAEEIYSLVNVTGGKKNG